MRMINKDDNSRVMIDLIYLCPGHDFLDFSPFSNGISDSSLAGLEHLFLFWFRSSSEYSCAALLGLAGRPALVILVFFLFW